MNPVTLDAPERKFVDFCALRALLNLCWDCTLWVALTAEYVAWRSSSGC
jgi:hypothetical protein